MGEDMEMSGASLVSSTHHVAGVADTDLDAIVVPSSVKLAGGLLVGAGVCATLIGIQALFFFRMAGAYQAVGPLALMLGGGCVFFGWGVVRGRSRAALAGLVVGALTLLFSLGWVALSLMNGVFSFISLANLPLSGLAAALVASSLKQVKAIDAARDRLRAQGLDAGL
jgi:hypothetical protein